MKNAIKETVKAFGSITPMEMVMMVCGIGIIVTLIVHVSNRWP